MTEEEFKSFIPGGETRRGRLKKNDSGQAGMTNDNETPAGEGEKAMKGKKRGCKKCPQCGTEATTNVAPSCKNCGHIFTKKSVSKDPKSGGGLSSMRRPRKKAVRKAGHSTEGASQFSGSGDSAEAQIRRLSLSLVRDALAPFIAEARKSLDALEARLAS